MTNLDAHLDLARDFADTMLANYGESVPTGATLDIIAAKADRLARRLLRRCGNRSAPAAAAPVAPSPRSAAVAELAAAAEDMARNYHPYTSPLRRRVVAALAALEPRDADSFDPGAAPPVVVDAAHAASVSPTVETPERLAVRQRLETWAPGAMLGPDYRHPTATDLLPGEGK